MKSLPVVDARQDRGFWVAQVISGAAALGLTGGNSRVPVIIEDENSRIDWRTHVYRSTSADSGLEAWWYRPQHVEWRELMLANRPILLRKAWIGQHERRGRKLPFFESPNCR